MWRERFDSIRDHERHLARNGVAVVKFWLNVSKEEQRRRFLSRLEDPEKNWKFRPEDATERVHWDTYMTAYQEVLRATSRSWAPWYAIPADDKNYMRMQVAEILVATVRRLKPTYPAVPKAQRSELWRLERALARRRA